MTPFFLFIAAALALLLIVTALLFRPLWQGRAITTDAESPALRVLREQRADLDRELAAGKITAEAHAQTLGELEARALAESEAPEQSLGKPRRVWAAGLALVLPLAAVALYLSLGNLQGLNPRATAALAEDAAPTAAQIDAMVAGLADRVKRHPDDLEGLQMLGRSYMVLGRFAEAETTFAQLASKKPEAQTYADWADAVASRQNRSLEGEPEKLVRQALKLDPNNIKALALSGTLAFERKQFKLAVADWEKIAARVPPESEFAQSVDAMLREARQRGGMPQKQAGAPSPVTPSPAAASPLKMRGTVTLAAALRDKASPDDALFLFARPAAGGPPFAGMRFKVSELPIQFDFAQAQLMMGSPDPKQKVIIGARISKRGNAMPQAGDLQGLTAETAMDATGIRIEIAEVVK
ncbi:c-type cytochrome biogenesis protein CcmI [Viridibacterium curvum]|uniref:C-type cytochrome biogenesis protein CcmI n=1 Tax=Viridibacterium curvum TaxID=1101404 RepID=A0ABP9R400_9RHOO